MRTSTTDALTIHRQGLVDTAPSVDADAMQADQGGGDYVVPVKDNRPALLDDRSR